LGNTEYGKHTGRLYKDITKAFFPKTQEALKSMWDTQDKYDRNSAQYKGEQTELPGPCWI
jgi:hypothetical protein